MDEFEKQIFVNELMHNVKMEILKKIKKMPEEWDGAELRWFIRDEFQEIVFCGYGDRRKKRYKDYRNSCIINGI